MWWQAAFEAVLDPILIWDNTRRYLHANPAACSMLLLTQQELTGMSIEEVWTPEVAGSPEDWRGFLGRPSWTGEFPFHRRDGEVRILEYQAVPNFWEQLHLGSFRDVTLERQAMADLRRQKELLQTIVDHIPVMINFIDSAGRIQWINREWEHVLGWTLEEARTTDILAEAYPDDGDRAVVLEAIERSAGTWRDFREYRKDGTLIDTAWANVRLSDGTRIGIGQEITQRKRAEAQLNASRDRLRRLVERADQRSEHQRHEISRELHDQVGQLLTGLKIDAMWIADQPPSPHVLEGIQHKAGAMAEHIDAAIRQVRRIASGLRPSVLDRLGLIEAIEVEAEEFERRTGVRCRLVSKVAPFKLSSARATQVFRIVQEALTNTARHASATRVNIEAWTDRGRLTVEVRDNGTGISDVAMRDDASLGLLGMRERARLVGGDLAIGRGDRRGTIVTFVIPLQEQEQSAGNLHS